jgi:formyl-CoA transferase
MRRAGFSAAQIEDRRRELRPDPKINSAYYRVFGTADGAIAVGAASPLARDRLFAYAGIDLDLLETAPEAVFARLTGLFVTRTSQEWLDQLRAIDVPVDRVRHFEELLFDAHVEAEELVVDIEHPTVGKYRALGSPIRLSGTPMRPGKPSPTFAADSELVLDELGYSLAQRQALLASGAVVSSGGND